MAKHFSYYRETIKLLKDISHITKSPMEEEEDAEMPAEELAALRLRAEAGDTQALFELGCELDGDESAVYLRRAAEGGHARAMVCYAEHLRWSGSTKEQAREAIQWHTKAAALHDAAACYYLGEIYRYGLSGMKKNSERAFYYHNKAYELGNMESAYALALDSLYYGSFCPWPAQEGARVLREVAEQSLNSDPLFWYAVICLEGRGMPRNPELAREWLQRCLSMSPTYDDARSLLTEIEAESPPHQS